MAINTDTYSYVYCITNLINGKKYIGSRTAINHLNDNQYLGSGKLISQALKKYGRKNFIKDILWFGPNQFRFDMEEYWIDYFNASENDFFYNIQKIPQKAFSGKNLSLEHRTKISKTLTGLIRLDTSNYRKPKSEQHRLNIITAMTGKKYPPERCKKASDVRKGKPMKHTGIIVICPFCQKTGGLYVMKQKHFNYCKYKIIFDILNSIKNIKEI